MFFNLNACPNGWTALAVARGRYLVGMPNGGTLGATVGTALTDQQNRAAGQHTHAYSPGNSGVVDAGNASVENYRRNLSAETNTGTGLIAGTNAPYLQLLACERN